MKKEIPIVLLTHGYFGKELIGSAELIVGKIESIQSVSLIKGMTIEEYYKEVKAVIQQFEGEVLVLTDMFGGTPSNISLMVQKEFPIHILCGVNLPMLLELVVSQQVTSSVEELLNKVINAGKDAIYQPKEIVIEEFDA